MVYIEFQYSTDSINWYPLPDADSTGGRDSLGLDGWGLTFLTENTPVHGTINDSSVWVRVRACRSSGSYTEWDVSPRPYIAEGEHFFEIGRKTFVPSRAVYRGKDPRILENKILWDRRRAFTVVYHFTKDRQLKPWAVVDSMDDCSYPWLVETPTEVLCAYYSQHEDGTCKVFLCAYDKKTFLEGPQPSS